MPFEVFRAHKGRPRKEKTEPKFNFKRYVPRRGRPKKESTEEALLKSNRRQIHVSKGRPKESKEAELDPASNSNGRKNE